MQLITDTANFWLEKDSSVAIGKFDGIHIGHQLLLEKVLAGKKDGLQAVIFTFDPSPASFFAQKRLKELTTREEKRKIFEKMGMDILIEFPLNEITVKMPPETFVKELLVKQIRAKKIAAGADLSFGDRGSGDYNLLLSMSFLYHYEVSVIDKICRGGREISSSLVREALSKGDLTMVTRLLGGKYQVPVSLCPVEQNAEKQAVCFLPQKEKLLPKQGRYQAQIILNERLYAGWVSITDYEMYFMENTKAGQTDLMDHLQRLHKIKTGCFVPDAILLL